MKQNDAVPAGNVSRIIIRLIAAILALYFVAAPGEPYQCQTDLECELAHPGTEVAL